MKTWVRKSLNVGVLSAGFLLVTGVTASAAHAEWNSSNNGGLLNGNQLDSEFKIPVDVSGNALAFLGFADASSDSGAAAGAESANATESWTTGYNSGGLNGNQVKSNIQAPISASGNALGFLGFADASGTGGAAAKGESASATESSWTSAYNAGALNGNQASNTVQVPIDLCGNAVGVFGFASASCTGGSWAVGESGAAQESSTGFNAGIANGSQVTNLIQAPINACGNAIAVFGFADASCTGGAGTGTGGDNGDNDGNGGDNGDGGYGGGTGAGNGDNGYGGGQSNGGTSNGHSAGAAAAHGTTVRHHHKVSPTKKSAASRKAASHRHAGGLSPAGVTNLAADEHGRSHAAADPYGSGAGNGSGGGAGAAAGAGACGGDRTTGYNAGGLNGNQTDSTIQVPIDISGNALALLGFASASSTGGAAAHSC